MSLWQESTNPQATEKIFQKKFEKPLDKSHRVCYNKYVIKRDYKIKSILFLKGSSVMTKKTQRDYFNDILALPNLPTDIEEFVKGRIAQLDKKNAGGKKQTATQIANASLKDEIIASMEKGKKYTITDMLKGFSCCADLSNQKISALVRQLVNDKVLVRTEDKRKAYFELA